MSKISDLIENLEELFRTGADENTSQDEMVELLDGMNFTRLLNGLADSFEMLYEYTVDGDKPYRGKPLSEHRGACIYTDPLSGVKINNVYYRHSLELWLLDDMTFLVTSCFSVMEPGKLLSEYRAAKSDFWRDTDMEIDFLHLAENLHLFYAPYGRHEIPVYEL